MLGILNSAVLWTVVGVIILVLVALGVINWLLSLY
jgi:hypothetical protein